jgi:hypothetical protein
MHDSEKYFPGLFILFFDVLLDYIAERLIARLVTLHEHSGGFIDREDMIVFV